MIVVRTFDLLVFCLFMGLLSGCRSKPAADLKVLTYDSLLSKGSLGEVIIDEFKTRCQCQIDLQSAGDAGQILARYSLDKSRKAALPHLLLGLDQNLFQSVKEDAAELIQLPKSISNQIRIDPAFVPFDYGFFSFIADMNLISKQNLKLPTSYFDLLKPEWRSKFIIQDPRTSSPGLGFLEGVERTFANDSLSFLTKLKGRWLTMPAGWDEAYGLFLKGEAPLVWSYTTSQAFHDSSTEARGRYKAVLFDSGTNLQIEGAVAIRSSIQTEREKDLTRLFLETLLSDRVQQEVPKRQWMYPARSDIKLPDEFLGLPRPRKIFNVERFDVEGALKKWSEASLR